jgi:hypothetical protein
MSSEVRRFIEGGLRLFGFEWGRVFRVLKVFKVFKVFRDFALKP